MRYAKIITLVIFSCWANFSLAESSEPPDGFRTAKWGSAPSSGLKRLTGPTSDGTSLYGLAPGKKHQPFFDTPVTDEDYAYTKRKFYSGSVYIDGQLNLEKLKTALSKVYGQPSFVNEKMKIWAWEWRSRKVKITLSHQEKFARTTVTFSNNGI